MIGQATDSGLSNNTMAQGMEVMFPKCNDPVEWDSAWNHVCCYAHKLGLVVKKALKVLGLAAGHVKPTTPPNTSIPVPIVTLNNNLTKDAINYDKSDDDEDVLDPPLSTRQSTDKDEDTDEYPTYEDVPTDGCIVVKGALKVSCLLSPFLSFPLNLSSQSFHLNSMCHS